MTQREGMSLARQNGILFLETSAATGHCVDEAFLSTAKNVLQKELKKHQDEMVQNPNNPTVIHGQDGYDYASLHPGGDVAFGPYAEAGKAFAQALAAVAGEKEGMIKDLQRQLSEALAREALCQQALAGTRQGLVDRGLLLPKPRSAISTIEASKGEGLGDQIGDKSQGRRVWRRHLSRPDLVMSMASCRGREQSELQYMKCRRKVCLL